MKAARAADVEKFQDIPNVGPAMEKDFKDLGYRTPQDLSHKDPLQVYKDLNALTKSRQDPCVLDTFMAVIDFMNGAEVKPWWEYTELRKKQYPDI